MIGIITYISVLKRTKEIGVLRSIGASKKDVSRIFNAETLIEGFVSGTLGILITLLLCIPANAIIYNVTTISNVAKLPVNGAIILIIISMVLTFIAGLVPAKMAAKKDPVVALRSE
jgi:putative ABC transport system permease protein